MMIVMMNKIMIYKIKQVITIVIIKNSDDDNDRDDDDDNRALGILLVKVTALFFVRCCRDSVSNM